MQTIKAAGLLNLCQGLLILVSVLPIFAIALWLPTQAQGPLPAVLERFLVEDLLGRVGLWSSNFPLESMAIANYIAVAAPLFAAGLAVILQQPGAGLPARLPVLAWHRYLLLYLGLATLIAFMLHYNYFTYVDFAHHRSKFRWVALNPTLFACFAATMLMVLEYLLFLSYLLFVHYPAGWLARCLDRSPGC
ncbi:hypothetical protein [Pseudomonas maumuensis]|uniref:Uncharacterized protein n=1 Tax=Pseudomonas maumuensis TaxID=2842354 RepID=A0ABX8NGJ8_9PSED|nr:hypothetical protein [Pseudomonas maumuensis]QXH55538.1 hypothetical protein KSS90_19715 [Pseudomonas maumuensis]